MNKTIDPVAAYQRNYLRAIREKFERMDSRIDNEARDLGGPASDPKYKYARDMVYHMNHNAIVAAHRRYCPITQKQARIRKIESNRHRLVMWYSAMASKTGEQTRLAWCALDGLTLEQTRHLIALVSGINRYQYVKAGSALLNWRYWVPWNDENYHGVGISEYHLSYTVLDQLRNAGWVDFRAGNAGNYGHDEFIYSQRLIDLAHSLPFIVALPEPQEVQS